MPSTRRLLILSLLPSALGLTGCGDRSIDERFESALPEDRGQAASSAEPKPVTTITVELFRKDVEKAPTEHFTRIRVGGSVIVDLPKGPWPQGTAEQHDRRMTEEARFAEIVRAIASAWAKHDKHPDVRGEITTPAPTGDLVPHGHVLRVLDAFLEAGVRDVSFAGASPPGTPRNGGGWDFAGK